ncbi:MAG: hypothetical protein ABWK00_01385 [Desulfurococcaceae archaeon]
MATGSAPSRRGRIREALRSHARNVVPGLLQALDVYCARARGRSCIDLLFDDPEGLREVLLRVFGSSASAELVAALLLRPLALEGNVGRSAEELAKLLVENPKELAEILAALEGGG